MHTQEKQRQPGSVMLVSHVDVNIATFRKPLIQALVARGTAVHVCVPDGPLRRGIEALGATVHPYDLARGSLNPATLPGAVRGIRRNVDAVGPDIVHSFTHQPNIFTRLAVPCGGPVVVNSVTGLGSVFLGTGAKGALLRTLFHTLYRATARRCAAMIFQNDDDRNHFASRGLCGPARIAMIRGSGVDLARFRPGAATPDAVRAARAALGLAPEHVVCTLTARLLFDKGVREFLDAADRLAAACPQARFLLVGEPDPGNPKSLSPDDVARAAARPNVVCAGWRRDMDMVWAMTDVAVLPSYREGLPVSLQEALAAGLPVVAADVPGCRDIAGPGGHCLLVAARESAPLAEALRTLIESSSLRRSMGTAARAKAEASFDATSLAAQHIDLYATLLEARP
ncbi:MAG: glycosyltransferase family 4 protein [Desulfovibrionaceae bacterium]